MPLRTRLPAPSLLTPAPILLPLLRNLKRLNESLYRRLNIQRNSRHFIIAPFFHDCYQRKILVHLSEHNGSSSISQNNTALSLLARNLIFQLLIPRWTFEHVDVRLWAIPAVDLGDVDDDVNVVAADLVGGHVDGGGVSRDVDFGKDVEEVGFFEAGHAAAVVEECFEGREVRDQLLDYFAEGFEDGVVVDGGQVEVNWRIFDTVVRELILNPLHDVALDIELVVIRETIDFVDEDFDVDIGVAGLQV